MAAAPSRVLYSMEIRRSRYFRRFLLLLVVALAVAGAYVSLNLASARGLADPLLLDVGKAVAILLLAILAVRGLYNLIQTFIRRSESLNVYNKGFIWNRGGKVYKYRWTDLVCFREGARAIYLFGRPVFQWGAHVLQMEDERLFKFRSYHGSTRTFARVVRPYAAYVTSVKISRLLRQDRPVRLHPRLTLYPGGVEAGKTQIRWSELDLLVRAGRLLVRRRHGKGIKTIRRYSIASVDNVGGFIDLVKSADRLHRRRRRSTDSASAAAQPSRTAPGNALSA
jgi:hypothetical protein